MVFKSCLANKKKKEKSCRGKFGKLDIGIDKGIQDKLIIFGLTMFYLHVNFAGNGHVGHCNQANNMFLFPGLDSKCPKFKIASLCSSILSLLLTFFPPNNIFRTCFRIGLGTLLSGSRIVSDGMLQAAAEWYFPFSML